ncbi:MAG TPA: ATP-binding protein [Rhodoglobus sp.]|nr:ATP-binding protein [Rhodoglobus sp.]
MRRPTLRRQLVLGIVGLLAAVTVVIGVVSVLVLRGFLVDRLDQQLAGATSRSQGAFDMPGAAPPPPDRFLAIAGQSPGTLGAVISEGILFASAVLNEDGTTTAISAERAAALAGVPPDGEPVTVDLGAALGDYRVVSRIDERFGAVLIVGLPLREVDATVAQLGLVVTGIGAIGLGLAAAAGAIVVRLSLRPLERVAATAASVSELPLDRDVSLAVRVPADDADGQTEVGRVGSAFNRMLDHVASALQARQASERRVRTFVADASHELRTPLAAIRGYAELTRRSPSELPPDVAHAIGRVESESVRMTGLVEDLLLLARLDEGRAPESAEVDLTRLLVDAVGDASAAGPDHEWSLDLPDEPVLVAGDQPRLHQVVANLLANARVHTPAGTRVTAALSVDGADAVLAVTDDGPGIDAALLPTVFERFVRGDASRSRASGSTGLGLAIVHAVVEAHGGHVEVVSEPGRTEFTVRLPLTH